MSFQLPDIEIEIFNKFNAAYSLIVIEPTDVKFKVPKPQEPDLKFMCRFCKRSSTDATFNNDAHKYPYSLGNRNLIWYEECDDCNKKFSDYEKNLSDYLGLHRTISDIRPSNKIFTFSTRDRNVKATRLGQMVLFERTKEDGFSYDPNSGKFTVDITPRKYTETKVYNALLKCALSALPEKYVAEYSISYAYLQDPSVFGETKGIRFVDIAETSLSTDCPLVLLFQCRTADKKRPLHVLCLYVRNFMFQIPLWHNEHLMPGKDIQSEIILAPFLDKSATFDEPFVIERYHIDLDSNEETSPSPQKMNFVLDKEALNNIVSVPIPPGMIEQLKGKGNQKKKTQ